MRVNINGREYDYTSDYDPINTDNSVRRNWKVSAGPYFKCPVLIGGIPCFVKRFTDKPEGISGYEFLIKIKGLHLPGLPVVHDVVQARENGKTVIYLFLAFIPGDTLDNLQRKGFEFVPAKLASDLFYAFQNIHEHGFWLPDFDTKNLYLSESGNFYVIDLDSTYPVAILPQKSLYGSKDYWGPVYDYYVKYIGYERARLKDLRGDILNQLQILYLVGLYAFFILGNGEDLTAYSLADLNDYLTNLHPSYKSILKFCFTVDPKSGNVKQQPLQYKVLMGFIQTWLFPGGGLQKISSHPTVPEIKWFKVNGRDVSVFQIVQGNKIEFEWNTNKAVKVVLTPLTEALNSSGKLTDVPTRDTIYTLEATSASKRGGLKAKRSIRVTLKPAKPQIVWYIKNEKDKKLYRFVEGEEYTIVWTTSYVTEVYIDEKKVAASGSLSFAATQNVEHVIRAVNSMNGLTETTNVSIRIDVDKLPVINEFSVSPKTLQSGQSVTLKWSTTYGNMVSIFQNGKPVRSNCQGIGSISFSLENKNNKAETFVFTLQVSTLTGQKTVAKESVRVLKPNRIVKGLSHFLAANWPILFIFLIGVSFIIQENSNDITQEPTSTLSSEVSQELTQWQKWFADPDAFDGTIDPKIYKVIPNYVTDKPRNRLFIKLVMETPDPYFNGKDRLKELINYDWNDTAYFNRMLLESAFKNSLLNSLQKR